MSRRRSAFAALVLVASLSSSARADVDDRLVLVAPNTLGQQGLVRITSAQIQDGGALLGVATRGFAATDFVLDGPDDAITFFEGQGVVGVGLFSHLELALSARAASALSSARPQPFSSVGDLVGSVKGGASFGVVGVAASARLQAPTRPNRFGYAIDNLGVSGSAHITLDLTGQGLPLRTHLNGGYTFEAGKLVTADAASNPFFFEGQDGALLALATQQWFFDHAHVGLGVEAPFPYATPFVEVWYETAIGANDYAFFGDAWLIVTPGVRLGLFGARLDLAVDVGLSGQDIAAVTDGQPHNPLVAGRVTASHAFDFSDRSGGGRFARLEGCVTTTATPAAPVPAAIVAITVDGQPGPRLAVDERGCFSAPVAPGALAIAVSAPAHEAASVTVAAVAGETARADVKVAPRPARGTLQGFVTTKEDEDVDATLQVRDGGNGLHSVDTKGGAFEVEVAAGRLAVVATAPGHLAQGARVVVDEGSRRTVTLVLRKEPKKRSVTLAAERLELGVRVPFVFRSQRLQSTAGYLLEEIADLLHTNPALRVSIEVHTDPTEAEDPTVAKALTEGRALVVKDALTDLGVDGARLETKGYGVTQLLGPPADPKNRRVELLVIAGAP